jgi:general secretion pathway protein M
MTKRRIRPRRGLALVIVGVAIAGGIVTAIAAVSQADRDSIEQSLDQLSSYRATIAARPQIETELKRLQQEAGSLPGLVPGANAPLAAANMQNEIRVIVSQAGGEIRSSQNLPPAVTEGFEKIEIAYDIALPMNRVSQLIYQLETHTPYLFVDRVDLEAPQNASPRSENVVPRIEAHWIIRGYRWKG